MAGPQAVIHSGFGSLREDAAEDGEGGLVFFQAGFFFGLNQALGGGNSNFEAAADFHFHAFRQKLVVISTFANGSAKIRRSEAGHRQVMAGRGEIRRARHLSL